MSQLEHRHVEFKDEGHILPKTDSEGRIYREVRCPNCRAFLCDEYIRYGRIRLKCFKCGKIIIVEFRMQGRGKAKLNGQINRKDKKS